MTDKKELMELQDKARRAGRTCNFIFDENECIDAVFYLDPKGPGRQKAGLILGPIAFAERERAKKAGWEESAPAQKARARRRR